MSANVHCFAYICYKTLNNITLCLAEVYYLPSFLNLTRNVIIKYSLLLPIKQHDHIYDKASLYGKSWLVVYIISNSVTYTTALLNVLITSKGGKIFYGNHDCSYNLFMRQYTMSESYLFTQSFHSTDFYVLNIMKYVSL